MPYNWNGDYVSSKADMKKYIPGFKEIGRVGQLIYHPFRFKNYTMSMDGKDYCAYPVCKKGKEPEILGTDSALSGTEILQSLFNLAKKIDNFDTKEPYTQLIINWCIENMHPYSVDFICSELTEEHFDIEGVDADFVERDGIFKFKDFMTDLGKLYNAARYYFVLQDIYCVGDSNVHELFTQGRYFEWLPFFEKYKHEPPAIKEKFNLSSPEGKFANVLYDDYEGIRNKLIECIPEFSMRLKIDLRTNKLQFSVDVYSVFDIAWYTFAKVISEDFSFENMGKKTERSESIMICCKCCGDFLFRRAARQEYCDKEECQKARKAQNQKDFRKRKKIEKAQKKKK